MSVILHVGIKSTAKKRAKIIWAASIMANPPKIFFDGDSWEEWGEPRTVLNTEHVVMRFGATIPLGDETDADLTADAIRHAGFLQRLGLLKPMVYPEHQQGIIASITREEWSDEIIRIQQVQKP